MANGYMLSYIFDTQTRLMGFNNIHMKYTYIHAILNSVNIYANLYKREFLYYCESKVFFVYWEIFDAKNVLRIGIFE